MIKRLRKRTIWLSVLVGGIILGFGGLCNGDDVPTADFLAAGLRNQELACGASLQLEYTSERRIPQSVEVFNTRAHVRYVRTAKVLFAEDVYETRTIPSSEWTSGSTFVYSYDRITTQQMRLQKDAAGNAVGGAISNGVLAGERFTRLDQMETSSSYVFLAPLYEIVKAGVVSQQREEVEGYPCWRVDVPAGPFSNVEKHVVWLDPETGFCPRQIDIVHPDATQSTSISLGKYQAFGDNCWFPMQQVIRSMTETGEELVVVCNVISIKVGEQVPDEDVRITFPSGTKVKVRALDAAFTVP